MKKLLILSILAISFEISGQVPIYQTTNVGTVTPQISPTGDGNSRAGDGIVLAGTARFLNSIEATFLSLSTNEPYFVEMSLYTDCPTAIGSTQCGSGSGTLIPNSIVSVAVTPPGAFGLFHTVIFPYSNLDLSNETDNTIYVMIKASRGGVYWRIGESITIGSAPSADDPTYGAFSRCGSSTPTSNGCDKALIPPIGNNNNYQMKVIASATPLNNEDFVSNSFSVYPNPVNDIINFANHSNAIINFVEITDMSGRVIKLINVNNTDGQVSVSDLPSGIYMMKLSAEQGIAIKKIVKR